MLGQGPVTTPSPASVRQAAKALATCHPGNDPFAADPCHLDPGLSSQRTAQRPLGIWGRTTPRVNKPYTHFSRYISTCSCIFCLLQFGQAGINQISAYDPRPSACTEVLTNPAPKVFQVTDQYFFFLVKCCEMTEICLL